MKSPAFIVRLASDGRFYFTLTARNGQVILTSQMYTAKSSCLSGVASAEMHATNEENYRRLDAKDGSYYFTLAARNHEVIGTSEMYTTKAARIMELPV